MGPMPEHLRWRLRRPLVALIALALAASLTGVPAAAADEASEWIVPSGSELPEGATTVDTLSVLDADVVRSETPPPDAVAFDTELSWHSEELTTSTDGSIGENYVDPAVTATKAPEVWEDTKGAQGLVALIDTGVADVPALEGAVAAEVDFTGGGGGDGFGHGTYLASLIAGRGDLAPGVAPEAGVVSLKVADDEGTTTLGQVLGAMQWLEGPGRSLGIRVASLSLGVEPDSPAGEVLDLAASHLAASGVLVVTATGNGADDGEGLTAPATAPGSFSAGALDVGTGQAAAFSASGVDRIGETQPDVLAPGVDVIGHLAPDSVVEAAVRENADEGTQQRLSLGLLRGSGTSAATALTAGVAALASDAQPELDGIELAEALRAGDGVLDAAATVEAAASMDSDRPVADVDEDAARPGPGASGPGNASGNGNRTGSPAHANGNGNGPPAHADDNGPPPHATGNGARDLRAVPMPAVAKWHAAQWNGNAWSGADWAVAKWHVAKWHSASWSVAKWHVAKWHVEDWDADHWDASHWDVAKWHAEDWSVAKWHVAKWHVAKWHAEDWSVAKWHVAKWHGQDWLLLDT